MASSRVDLLEAEVNRRLANQFRAQQMFVLQNVRLHPCELDIVVLDPLTLALANIEIKRANWRAVLRQAIRGQLFCHYSVAVLPVSMRSSVPVIEFEQRGIGLAFYTEAKRSLKLAVACQPGRSHDVNRLFKRLLYRQFSSLYSESVYA